MNTKAKLTFWGGVGTVTGANFVLDTGAGTVMVDCGMFQGRRMCGDENYEPFPYQPSSIDTLLVTHAHMDHIGRIPKLVREGFQGTIRSTPATKALAAVMLVDAAGLIAEEARKCGLEAPYGEKDVDAAIALWETTPYYETFDLAGMKVTFRDAGHILGSAFIECVHPVSGKIVFSGDLGNSPTMLLRDTDVVKDADYMVIESVYGDRLHEPAGDRSMIIEDAVEDTIRRGGTLLIPAFSIERSQLILYELNNLVESNRIPRVPIFLDSPLAIKVTEIYRHATADFNEETKAAIKAGDDVFAFRGLKLLESSRESRTLREEQGAKIIIAGSGMSHGGRIIAHEKHYLSDPKNTLLIVGYQSPGSLGRRLQDGSAYVTIDGDKIPVRARIQTIRGFSGHRDMDGLLEFVNGTNTSLKKLFVTMGEPKSSQFLAQRARDYLGVNAVCPQVGDTVELG